MIELWYVPTGSKSKCRLFATEWELRAYIATIRIVFGCDWDNYGWSTTRKGG